MNQDNRFRINAGRTIRERMRTALPVALLLLLSSVLHAEGDLEKVWQAVERNDPRSVRMAAPGVECDVTRPSDGHTPLTLAASKESFECVRELLWAGASADHRNGRGKIARDYLQPGTPGFTSLILLLRCHSFVEKEADSGRRAEVPHRVIINDSYVDPDHPDYRDRYWVNLAEKNGRTGVDDDGNGFVDDISGWNVAEDLPLRMPSLALESLRDKEWLRNLIAEVARAYDTGDETIQERLSGKFENPLARQLGIKLARDRGFHDWDYGEQLYEMSHGTHVAGIVMKASQGKAELHGVSWEQVEGTVTDIAEETHRRLFEVAERAAAEQPDYTGYLRAIRDDYLTINAQAGRRFSQYLRSSGAGVVNMSYGQPVEYFRNVATALQELYKKQGNNPDSLETHACPIGMDLCGELAIELQIARGAFYAVAAGQNPDVLFVAAAGNEARNNDAIFRIPTYLSRFFPNFISVANVDSNLALAESSNYGLRSVLIAGRGTNISSSILGGIQAPMTGTSMAAPEVAGVAAALRSTCPKLRAPEVRRILLASAEPVPGLRGKVGSAAVVNLDRALALAENWEKGLALFLDEPWDWPTAPDEAPAVPHRDGRGDDGKTPGGATPPPSQEPVSPPKMAVTSLGGFGDNWRVVATEQAVARHQGFIRSEEWPGEWLNENYNQGFRVTAIGGDGNGWAILTQEAPEIGPQRLVGFSFDQTTIKANFDEGYRIRCFAGYGSQWVYVMDLGTGYGTQRFTLPSPFDDQRRSWIRERWNEGYRITSVAGENGPGEQDSWALVMSQNSGLEEQAYEGPGPWPAEWIQGKWAEGYFITGVTGYGSNWLVVMSKGRNWSGLQRYSGQLETPDEWVEEQWQE